MPLPLPPPPSARLPPRPLLLRLKRWSQFAGRVQVYLHTSPLFSSSHCAAGPISLSRRQLVLIPILMTTLMEWLCFFRSGLVPFL